MAMFSKSVLYRLRSNCIFKTGFDKGVGKIICNFLLVESYFIFYPVARDIARMLFKKKFSILTFILI